MKVYSLSFHRNYQLNVYTYFCNYFLLIGYVFLFFYIHQDCVKILLQLLFFIVFLTRTRTGQQHVVVSNSGKMTKKASVWF